MQYTVFFINLRQQIVYMKQLLILFTAIILGLSSIAQQTKKQTKTRKEQKRERINALARQEEEGIIAHKKHFAAGVKLVSDGYGVFFEKGKAMSVKKALLFQLEISERKHQKEEKQTNPFVPSTPFYYGKLNFFYPVKLGVQQQFLLGNKSNKNGVSVTANVGGGLTLGLLRPYEIKVDDSTGKRRYIKYDSPDSLLFINAWADPSVSGPGFGTGWNGIKFTPGAYIKSALRFDYGSYNEMVNAIEVGVSAEFYSKKIPQQLYSKQTQFFFSAYFSVMFGKRKK